MASVPSIAATALLMLIRENWRELVLPIRRGGEAMTKYPKRVLLFVATFGLASCAHVQTEWRSSTGATSSQLERDAADCQFKANLASFAGIFAENTEPSSANDLEQMCMNRKGYYQPVKKP